MQQRQDIIKDLVDDLTPFRSSLPFYLYWVVLVVTALAVIVTLLTRSDSIEVSLNRYFLEIVALSIVGFWSLFHAFRYADPMTHRVKRGEKLLALILLSVSLGMYLIDVPQETYYFANLSWISAQQEIICSLKLMMFGLGACVLTYLLLKRLAPFKINHISFFSVLAGISLATLVTRILCISLSSGHFLLYHYVPALLGLGGGIWGMKLLLNFYGRLR